MSAAEQALATADAVPLSLRGPAPTRVVAGYGFWLFLLSDIVIFRRALCRVCSAFRRNRRRPNGRRPIR